MAGVWGCPPEFIIYSPFLSGRGPGGWCEQFLGGVLQRRVQRGSASPHLPTTPVAGGPSGTVYCPRRRGVAQSGSAPEWGSGGRWFESSRPDHPHYLPAAHLRLTAGTPPRSATPAASLPSPPATLAAARSAGRQGRLPVPHSRWCDAAQRCWRPERAAGVHALLLHRVCQRL